MSQIPNDNFWNHEHFVVYIFFFDVAIVTRNMGKKLSDEEVAELLQGDISDLEELDEGDDINIDNLNEILNTFPDNIEVSISIYSIKLEIKLYIY